MNIAAIVGSLRRQSYNRQLVETMQQRYSEKMNIRLLDIGTLPHFNQDQELDPPDIVKQFKQAIQEADGVLIATPEYNWSIPGVLKNALDWISRGDKVLVGKPVLVVGASTGLVGTIRAQLHLRDILANGSLQPKMLPPAGNEVLVNFAQNKFDEQGRLTDEDTLKFLDGVVDKYRNLVQGALAPSEV